MSSTFSQAGVARVLHPALESHPGHAIWKRDFSGSSGIFSIVLAGGGQTQAHAFLDALRIFGLGYSWGGFESLITHETPQLAHRLYKPDLPGQLLRLHIGLEDPADLIADLENGLEAWRALQDSNLQHPA